MNQPFVNPYIQELITKNTFFSKKEDLINEIDQLMTNNLGTQKIGTETLYRKDLLIKGLNSLILTVDEKNKTRVGQAKSFVTSNVEENIFLKRFAFNYATESVLATFISEKDKCNRINLFLLIDCYIFLKNIEETLRLLNNQVKYRDDIAKLNILKKDTENIIFEIYERIHDGKIGFSAKDYLIKNNLIAFTEENLWKANEEQKRGGKKSKRKKPKKRSRKTRKC